MSPELDIVEGIRRLPENEIFRERLGDGRQIPMLAADPFTMLRFLGRLDDEFGSITGYLRHLDIVSAIPFVGAAYEHGQRRRAQKEAAEVEMFHRPEKVGRR